MKKTLFLIPLSAILLIGCNNQASEYSKFTDVEITNKILSKEEYFNKTLGGLLGQFAGFLSGYEFVWDGPNPYVGMPLEWFEFLNGPYAGNYDHYFPGDYATQGIYDRHKLNEETNMYEVWSDDDYHNNYSDSLFPDSPLTVNTASPPMINVSALRSASLLTCKPATVLPLPKLK